MNRILRRVCVLLLTLSALIAAAAQQPAASSTPEPWWKHAVFYEIYPRSFQDSNNDGIGDLNGITSRLDYLKELGVDAVWLTPIYPSPQVDFGYDISDYEAIDPTYGTMQDFDRMVSEARKRNIRIIMDFVLNHTSDKHPWFIESESSRTNPKRDWYVWQDGKNGAPPTNWQSYFGHSAWQFDAKTGQYYYHKFYVQQPDLNWRNPEVRKAMYDVMRFWYKRGVAGFRLDAFTTLFEDPNLQDEPVKPGKNAFGDPIVDHSHTTDLPEVQGVMREVRRVSDEFPGTVLIGEIYSVDHQQLARMYGENHDELQLPMDTQVGFINKLSAVAFREKINESLTLLDGNQPLYVFDNHDRARMDRYSDGRHTPEIDKLLGTVLLTTPSAALLYYGDELGMTTHPPTRKEDVKDPIGIIGWPKEKGRDGERTPMQWDSSTYAGFSNAPPWLPVPADHEQLNVAAERSENSSVFSYYQRLIQLRRTNSAMRDGRLRMLNCWDAKVLSYMRESASGAPVVVIENFSASPVQLHFSAADLKTPTRTAKTLASSFGASTSQDLASISIPGFGAWVGQIE